jgi:hypothetical protein
MQGGSNYKARRDDYVQAFAVLHNVWGDALRYAVANGRRCAVKSLQLP